MFSGIKKIIIYLGVAKRRFFVWISYTCNYLSVILQVCSRKIIQNINRSSSDFSCEYFVLNKITLLRKIKNVIKKQKAEYKYYSYFFGYPYQAFNTLGVFGERSTEERYKHYQLDSYLEKHHQVLDLGCNCGFVGIFASYRKGCNVTGIDINPFAIEIGRLCVDFLDLNDKVNLLPLRIQDLNKGIRYDGIFSFAIHWTDDKNYRIPLQDHFNAIYDLLKESGLLFFESHAVDVGNQQFHEVINNIKNLFAIVYKSHTDAGARYYYIFRKI